MLQLDLVISCHQKQLVKSIIENHHSYVPTAHSVGRRIDWLIRYDGRMIGMIGVGSSVYPPPKDLLRYLHVSKNEYKLMFNNIANNWRFCLTEKVKNIGTQILKEMRRHAPYEWKKKYGDELTYLLTFVGAGHDGGIYKADNWEHIGSTSGLPPHKSSSMKWNDAGQLKRLFVKPTGQNKKLIFITPVKTDSIPKETFGGFTAFINEVSNDGK